MLGQDPVYYYDKDWALPDGKTLHEPDTMEPVWTSGKSPPFVDRFLDMITAAPSLRFAYAQMGQENAFPWPRQADAYPMQMKALAELRDQGSVHVETMEASGRRFRKRFTTTPAQAQVQLQDPFGNTHPTQRSIWYQSRFYRANLHLDGDIPYLRDLTVYSDKFPQPFLDQPTREHWVQQRMPALLDGYHWSPHPVPADGSGAGGFFTLSGKPLRLTDKPSVREDGDSLVVDLPVGEVRTLQIRFDEQQMSCRIQPVGNAALAINFAWDPAKAALTGVSDHEAHYQWQGFGYSARVTRGTARATDRGWAAEGTAQGIALMLAQPA
jgi:hypothetical protein